MGRLSGEEEGPLLGVRWAGYLKGPLRRNAKSSGAASDLTANEHTIASHDRVLTQSPGTSPKFIKFRSCCRFSPDHDIEAKVYFGTCADRPKLLQVLNGKLL